MKKETSHKNIGRRKFITDTGMAAAALGSMGIIASCKGNKPKKVEEKLPVLLTQAPDGPVLKAGLIGCGGRGAGAAVNFVDAGPNLQITALGDVFQDRLDQCREQLKKERNIEIADEKCFIGFDSYQQVIDSDVDIVLLCTPPHFRPAHIAAAVQAGKHIFLEKPCAVDPVGARSVMVSVERANFCWLSGDHIVEQFIHEIDVMNWYIGRNPVKAIGWGGRQRRVSGDQYDFFSIEYIYDNGMHTHCAARQITGCSNITEQFIVGTQGFANARGTLFNLKGEEIWKYPEPEEGSTDNTWKVTDPYVQEHINLVTGIPTGNAVHDAEA